jgi:hypothetical protein
MRQPIPAQILPAPQPMILLHCVWMTDYEGFEKNIYAKGFKYPAEHGWGAEMFNFKNFRGRCYGHVEVVPRKIKRKIVHPQLKVEKLGAAKGDSVATNVLVVWTAPDPRRAGRTVVGWYQNATVYREFKTPEGALAKSRTHDDILCAYRVMASAQDCVLIPPEKRALTFPPRTQGQKGIPGEFSAYYPGEHGEVGQTFVDKIQDFIAAYGGPAPRRAGGNGGWQVDPLLRKAIEDAAVKLVWSHFEDLRYDIENFQEKDGEGYDLKATRADEVLCIEVKGKSGNDIGADFTHHEYRAIRDTERGKFVSGSYRICIVTDALGSPRLYHFIYWPKVESRQGGWRTIDGTHPLEFTPLTAARASVVR